MADQFDTLEINSSFYRLMPPKTFQKWAASVPDGFEYAVKGWKNITHMRRLKNCADDIAIFFSSGVMALKERMGPILWQLPPSLHFDAPTLETFLTALPRTFGEAKKLGATAPPPKPKDSGKPGAQPAPIDLDVPDTPELEEKPLRYALEPRSSSFDSPEALAILRRYDTALVMADTAGRYPRFDQVTANMVYIRLHGSPRMYYSNYSEPALASWSDQIRAWAAQGHQVFCYFDNTAAGYAPYNAQTLKGMCSAA